MLKTSGPEMFIVAVMTATYPIGLEVAPAAPQGRLGIFFRLLIAIPALIIASLIGDVAQILGFIAWLIILVTGKLPGGIANFIGGAVRWQMRVYAYVFLLTDKYPPFSLDDAPDYPVHVSIEPQLDGRNRLTVFFRFIMIIPSAIVLYIVLAVASILLFFGWLVAVFTGSVPGGIHNFVAGALRWWVRLTGYMYLLTDQYPPFSLS